ncbi:MAG TPA: hypothetical protein VKP65_10855 [Rhodothermales bacterium]|nr:hypothetical protein [Rhodothermales bacterium]
MTIRKLFFSILTVALLFVATGCDSNDDDDQSDAELFVGTWNAVGVSDGTGDQTQSFASSISQFQIVFDADGTYDLSVVFTDQRSPIQFSNASYSVNETTDTITLVIPAAVTGSGDLSLPFSYDFESDTRVGLSNTALVPIINSLFQTTYTGTVTITVQK